MSVEILTRGRVTRSELLIGNRRPTLREFRAFGVTLIGTTGNAYREKVDRLRMGFFDTIASVFETTLRRENRALVAVADGVTDVEVAGRLIEAQVTAFYAMDGEYRRTYITIVPTFAERVYDRLVGDKAAGRGYELKADDDLLAVWEQEALRFIEEEAGDLITAVEAFTHEEVVRITRNVVARAIKNEWSVNDMQDALVTDFDNMARYRARRIARTEVMRSASYGSREGARATGLDLRKMWLTANDGDGDRHTDILLYPDLHGQRREFNAFYNVGGWNAMYPQDLRLPGSESINCRCTEIYDPV